MEEYIEQIKKLSAFVDEMKRYRYRVRSFITKRETMEPLESLKNSLWSK